MFDNDKITLYSRITDYLKDKITSRELLPGEKLPTEAELMEQFNVSRITAKRALEELKNEGLIYRKKGQGSFVNPSLLKKEGGVNKIISMIIPYNSARGRLIHYIRGATDFLYSKGYYLTVNCTDDDINRERQFLSLTSNSNVGGIIYYPLKSMANFDVITTLSMDEYPIVVIDKYFESLPLSYVMSDNFDGGLKATSHLISLGHRKISYVARSAVEYVSSVRDRYLGYCKALKNNGIKIDNNIIVTGYSKETGHMLNDDEKGEALKHIVGRLLDQGVTAIFAENDYIAFYLIKTLLGMGVKVPEEVSIIGFDNVDEFNNMGIALTTVEQNFYQIGKKAAELIVDIIESKKYVQKKVVIPVNLVLKESTSPVLNQDE